MTSLLPFRLHLVILVLCLAAYGGIHAVTTSRHQRRQGAWALVALAAVTIWPVGDLAASVSLTVATVQRLVIMLLVAPLLLLSLPPHVLARLTRPAPIDFVVRRLAHPGIAMILVLVLGTYSLSTPVVDFGATSSFGRGLILIGIVALGIILWMPALGVMPGTKRLSPAARAGYVFASALVVTSLSFVWIFSRHSLYPDLHHQFAILHMTPLFDQQLAGFVAKLGAYFPMWAVAFTIFFNADDQGIPVEESPLHWADVERQLERVDRQRARNLRRHRPS